MLQFCARFQTEPIHSFSPKPEAVADFLSHTTALLETTVWADAWY